MITEVFLEADLNAEEPVELGLKQHVGCGTYDERARN